MAAYIVVYLLQLLVTSTSLADSVQNFNIGFLPAMTNNQRDQDRSDQYGHLGKTYAGAINVAMDSLRADPSYRDFNFSYSYADTRFDVEVTLKNMVVMDQQGIDAYIGPESNCVMSAKLASALNKPMIGFRCLDSVLSDKKEYPTFARTVPGTAKVSKSILALFEYYQWSSFSVVHQLTEEWSEVSRTLGVMAEANNIHVNSNDTFKSGFRFFDEEHKEAICDIVKKTSNLTRVYVFLGQHDPMVCFMKCLYSLSDIELHAVIHVRGFNDVFDYDSPRALEQLTTYWIEYESEDDPDLEVKPFHQLITLLHRKGKDNQDYQNFENLVRKYLHKPPFNVILPPSSQKIPVSVYAAKVYDAVMLYARAVQRVIQSGNNPRDGRVVMQEIFNTTFLSIQNFTDTIDENGDAEGAYSTVAIVKKSEGQCYTVKPVGNFAVTESSHLQYRMLDEMSWINGVPVSDPKCGFNGEKCQIDRITIIVTCVVVTSLLLIFTILAICCWRQYTHKTQIDKLLWKLDKCDIEIIASQHGDVLHGEGALESTEETPWQFLEDDNLLQEKPSSQLPYYTPVGYYKNMLVSIKEMRNNLEVNSTVKKHLYLLREITHENLNKFVGVCIDSHKLYLVNQYCHRGSLEDVLVENRELFLEDSMMRFSLINDLVKGMLFIHESAIGFHGDLRSSKCLLDSRLVLQITGFGLHHFRKLDEQEIVKGTEKYYRDLMWKAPELLRESSNVGTQKGDVYAFAIILHEILGLMGPWGGTRLNDKDIVQRVREGKLPYLRPNMSILSCDDYLIRCMEDCWNESPDSRPDFKVLHYRRLKPLHQSLGSNILENMLQRIERYTKNLEGLVEERTMQLNTEKKKTEKLLLRMLPRSVAEDLKRGKPVQASYYECVTIYFSDIVGFTKLCSESDPYQIVKFLNDLYTKFDGIIDNYDVYKVETIGDAYMVVSGLPKRNGDNHAGEIASMSLHLLSAMKNFKIHHRPTETLKLRIGIHSGPVAVGVVGIKMPRYCLFGDTVNTTSRMESNGLPLKIHCSVACKTLLDNLGGYYLEQRGLVEMKGKGEVLTYWLVGEDSFQRIKRLAENQEHYSIDSTCTSARSSFNDSLHLMPNGFRRPKLTRDNFSLDEFRLKHILKKNLRRGSMPVNNIRRGSLGLLEVNNRRDSESDTNSMCSLTAGSSPVNNRRNFEIKSGWELNEDDERKASIESQTAPLPAQSIRASPEGCDCELTDTHIDKTRQQVLQTSNAEQATNNNNTMSSSTSIDSIPELRVTYADEVEEGQSVRKEVRLSAEPTIIEEEKTCISVV